MSRNTLYYGSFVHSTSLTQLEYLVDALVYVSDGSIVWIERDIDAAQLQEITAKHGLDLERQAGLDFVQLDERDFICPGLIDTHTHAPQYPNLGLGQEYELLDWLQQLTFPGEAKFTDLEYAQRVYDEVVKRNLNAGLRNASMLSKMLAIQPETPNGHHNLIGQFTNKPLSIPTLFYLATLGGAALCKMENTVGNFLPGKEFDALHVTPGTSPNFFLDVGETRANGQTRDERRNKLKQTFERFLFVSDDRDIAHVYVRGRRVGGAK
ncbi:hypothetical protein QFC19_001202 [Naganishia cerealis]|uniref:Uncharacterized protein n=1 Tax=Naganishia cerealis TaxID=610337 RepID=A0ACC2WIY4_9TREE|nr:hypothetical protein QFC19_001202 [Naganishia cerealis]